MKKSYRLQLAVLSCLAVLAGLTSTSFAMDHPEVQLLDHNGFPIAAAAGATTAYSSMKTCNFCHDSEMIEKHSYHAQIGTNEMKGWMAFNPNSPDKYKAGVATKGKSWVQSPGHIGKW
ncbi:hypothetical protein SAMN02745165_00809 [Malonomonas rubra DSM 5091]|uniref:Cytochrome c domain-containing protein n=1 Tax=Malonomonas rubra DSM 5091 TaxID=1122189 RepID=A0A1M6DUX7_MALRU|nr:hypothetical protein [Malonomonas rubra]SHI76828.1 hypothetical protein SAMN02745165_00809 [Malonomonas rubra DSM 5091]